MQMQTVKNITENRAEKKYFVYWVITLAVMKAESESHVPINEGLVFDNTIS